VWDGSDHQILLEQHHSDDDDIAHFNSLIGAFKDARYIRINGKPLFLVYRTGLLPNPGRTSQIWRQIARREGVGEIFLARVESHGINKIDPREIGFDAAVQFAPELGQIGKHKFQGPIHVLLAKMGLLPKGFVENMVGNYVAMRQYLLNRREPDFLYFKCVTPCWDNTPRRKPAWILPNSSPELYEEWLRKVVDQTMSRYRGDERIVFINAWNEWAEGNHLEPDLKWGHAYLEATRRAITSSWQHSGQHDALEAIARPTGEQIFSGHGDSQSYPAIKQLYWKIARFAAARLELLRYIGRRTKW